MTAERTFIQQSLQILKGFTAAQYLGCLLYTSGVALSGLAALLLGVVMTNGLLEMAIGAVIVLAVGRVLLPLTKGKIKKAAGE